MRHDRRAIRVASVWVALMGLMVPVAVIAGLQAQGLQAQGLQAQGLQAQGLQAQGLQAQGLQAQGAQLQGLQAQGLQAQGLQAQGLQAQGVALLGSDLMAADLVGVEIGSVEMRGTTTESALQSFDMVAGPGNTSALGGYILIGGGSAVGHYATAHLVDVAGNPAEDLDLYIADERPDPVPNLLHRGDDQINDDVTLYTVFFFHKWSGQWASLCPFHAATGGATAMAIVEDPAQPSRFVFACTATGVASKCARGWGFRPWRDDHSFVYEDASGTWVVQTHPMKPFYDACKIAARAAYCQDRQSFTREGTLVDLFDTRQFVWPNAIENPFGDDPDSRWMFAQEFFVSVDPLASHPELKASALQRTRYRDLSPVGECADLAFVDRLEQDHFEDGRWASPLTGTPRVEVFSPNYCVHNEQETGAGLPWDCSPCTTAVCKNQPRCCRLDGAGAGWDALCVAEAQATCDDPPGRVWPRDVTPAAAPPAKVLLGPGGAVERVDGPGAEGAVTLSGWACDPEWPGAAVIVAIYGGAPREQPGSELLGQAYADQPLAVRLASEVSAACDGAVAGSARHGFTFAAPPNAAGNLFVYALDAATTDGPAAPPTLLRNGIVDAEGAIGAGRQVAAITTGWIEAPASGTFTFSSAAEPSRVFVNGEKLVDWWSGSGSTAGSINLMAGGRYPLRWDRLDRSSTSATAVDGVTWQAPGSAAQASITPTLLYRVTPSAGQGLAASYFAQPGFAGTPIARVDAGIDLGTAPPNAGRLPAGIVPPGFSVLWQGEVTPLYSDAYTFVVTSAGTADLSVGGQALLPAEVTAPPLAPACPHDICALGDKLSATSTYRDACHPCVDQVCAQDPYCCDGGYLSYYSTEPVWDAKCVAEVGAICGLTCKNPLPSATTRERAATPIPLLAGVRYSIRLAVDNPTSDVTTQLLWESARQMREVVPARALYFEGAAANAGAGLNTVLFATTSSAGGSVDADFTSPLASGPAPDFSIGGGQPNANRLQLVDVLADPSDPVAAVPPPPAVVSPRRGAHDVEAIPQVSLTVLGGVRGGSVHAQVQGTSIDVSLPLDANGNLIGGAVPVSGYGAQTLVLSQRTYAGTTCGSTAPCAESAPIVWDVVVDERTPAAPPPPVISAPRDPTSSPDPLENVFQVSGHGIATSVQACDQGGIGSAGVVSDSLRVDGDGNISGSVVLTSGTAVDPNPGWHKLSLSQDGCTTMSKPVFISVGINPPTVEFPRTSGSVDCSAGNLLTQLISRGTLPYSPSTFGPLIVAEELGHLALGLIPAQITVDATPGADGSYGFQAVIPVGLLSALPLGKHLLYFFQAPPPPANATQAEIDAHYRAFASVATTPTSRIEVPVPPPPLTLPAAIDPLRPLITAAAPILSVVGCALQLGAGCAQPRADINVRDGARLWTTRASAAGDWQISLADLAPGWHQLTLGQVVDSPAGGGWIESCPSPSLPLGVTSAAGLGPTLALPTSLILDATSAAGAALGYGVSATTASGTLVAVD